MSVKSDKPNRPGEGSCRKNYVALGSIERRPGPDAPFHGPANTGAQLRMAPPDLVKNRHWPQARRALQQGHHLAVPNRCQRIAPPAAARRFLLRRQSPILFDAIGSRGAEPGFGRGNGRRLGLAETHIQPHLTVGDVAAGQAAVPHQREEPASYPTGRDRQKTWPLQGPARRQIRASGRATPSLRHASGDTFSS